MKKTAIFLSIVLLFSIFCFAFSGCSQTESGPTKTKSRPTKTELTIENASQYLTFDLKGGGDDFSYYNGKYEARNLQTSGSISGVAGYTYENVVITVSTTFKYSYGSFDDKKTQTITSNPIQLNVGGCGTVVIKERATLDAYDIECLGYEIVSISGYVYPQGQQ